MNIKLFRNFRELKTKQWIFPGGELGIKIEDPNLKLRYHEDTHQTVFCRAQNANDLFGIALAKDALEQTDGKNLYTRLFLPYLPYARQDRVCDRGESFSLKVVANFINSLKFDEVIILDPHSDVSPALIDNIKVISQFDIIRQWQEFKNRIGSNCIFVSPDAGSNKKTAKIAGYFNHSGFARADKLRDLTNGNILETIVYENDFGGKDVICCDDLIDGGRTFTELAKVCKAKNCGKFVLYCTHGIFSKGTKLENIDEIWTTDSFRTDLVDVNVLNVEKFLTV